MSADGNAIGSIVGIRMYLAATWRGITGTGPRIPGWMFFGGKPRVLQKTKKNPKV